MTDAEKRLRKVSAFYQSLPSDLIEAIIGNLPCNRDLRRTLSKIKTNKEKIEMLFLSKLRKMFADTAYNCIKDYIALKLEEATYDDIINEITDDNKNYISIFFFRWCYELDDNGIDNDQKYFDIFVDSDIFKCILNGDSVKDAKINNKAFTEKEKNIEENDKKINKEVTFNKKGEVNTMKLLGRIEKRNTFYNFFPQYELIDGRFTEISVERLKANYPTNGGVNLAYNPYSGGASYFLDEINVDNDEDECVSNVYVIELNRNDLEENENATYQVKLDLQRLVSNGKRLHDVIRYAYDYNVYKVVNSDLEIISDKNFISGNINLRETNITEGEKVVLYYNEKYFGPFKALYRTYDDKFYINISANESNYLVPFFSANDIELIELEKQAYYKDPKFTRFIYTSDNKPKIYDAITDEILLEKIPDDISIDLAQNKPEEFSHLYSNSPFLAKLPKDIIANRSERLLEIIDNVEMLKEKKREIFEALVKVYQASPSEISDKMAADSDIYKELQSKYSEERRKSEDAEKQIQELKKAQEELNTQIVEIRKNSSGDISSEEKAMLQATIEQLQQDLKKKNEIICISESIEELEEKQKKLQTLNEDLIIQKEKYSRQIKDLRTDVSNAIKSGQTEMASLAFDPYISSEMMKQAASWDAIEESREYKERLDDLNSVVPSQLSGNALINYIVDYVKARREYSRNDIINIYISIAQNFITIFSGEPGTGKTSMCNIIAETLGLLNYGEHINRFVSVSVERGWSSKRDLIGYYNPLTRKYDKSNSKVYDALRMLDEEGTESKYPFIIMLDEANLSPIEYYWADFMRLTDRSSINDMYINIGVERELYVPNTLRFVATINTDQTTETLSPRLIDRACIIKLPKVEPKYINNDSRASNEIITWSNFIDTFSKVNELNPITQKAIKDIYKLFIDYGMSVSPRIQMGIQKYVMTAQEIMEDEPDALAREKALDFAIVQKLLPKINGYYTNYERFFDSMKQLCKEYNLNMTDEAITKIIEAQGRNMGYCQYLI